GTCSGLSLLTVSCWLLCRTMLLLTLVIVIATATRSLMCHSSWFCVLNTFSLNLSNEYRLTFFILIRSCLDSSINTDLTTFFHIIGKVFRLLSPSYTINEVSFVFTLLISKRPVYCYVQVSNGNTIWCITQIGISCESSYDNDSIQSKSLPLLFVIFNDNMTHNFICALCLAIKFINCSFITFNVDDYIIAISMIVNFICKTS